MVWRSSESGNKTTVYFSLNALLAEMARQSFTELHSIKQTSRLKWTKALVLSQESPSRPSEPPGSPFSHPITSPLCNQVQTQSQQSVTANCLLKHKAMDSEKHPDFFTF